MSEGWRRSKGTDKVRRSVVNKKKGRRFLLRYQKPRKSLAKARNGATHVLQYADIANEQEQIAHQSSNGSNRKNGLPAHNPNRDSANYGPQEFTPKPSFMLLGPVCPRRKKLLAPTTYLPPTSFNPVTNSGEEDRLSTESLIESLPLDLLVRILCSLHHDQLKPSFHVCQKFRQAVVIARQCHFNYTTPNHDRREAVRWFTPRLEGSLPLMRQEITSESFIRLPTPKPPQHTVKLPQSQICIAEMQHLAASLFQPSPICGQSRSQFGYPSVSYIRGASSHRVLFYEEELCQAVSHNKI